MRIVSLLPSATEILYALNLGEDLVGITHECDWPPEARGKRIVSHSTLPTGARPAEVEDGTLLVVEATSADLVRGALLARGYKPSAQRLT